MNKEKLTKMDIFYLNLRKIGYTHDKAYFKTLVKKMCGGLDETRS